MKEVVNAVYCAGEDCETYHYGDPKEIAQEYIDDLESYDGEEFEIYEGESYIPTNQDEIDFMEAEEMQFLVKNVKLFAKYRYDKKNDCVVEVKL